MKVNKINESGRSMVEMLGVLAIVGILSVGGVVMYRTAMNKHRANELLNEASKRATVVAMQYAEGKTTGSITEFDNNDMGYAKFKTEGITFTNGTFSLAFDPKPDENVCDQMIDIAGENSIMQIAEDCSEITFNADLTIGNGENGGGSGETPSIPVAEPNGCEECEAAGKLCLSNSSYSGYECVAKPTGCEACTKDQYCEYTGSSSCNQAPTTGICKDKPSNEDTVTDGTTTLYVGPSGVNWWTANEYCKKFHTRLATIADFSCSEESVSKMKSDGYYGCCKPGLGITCGQSGADVNKEPDLFAFALRKGKFFWLNGSYDSCYAFYVNYPGNNVHYFSRDYFNNFDALCR